MCLGPPPFRPVVSSSLSDLDILKDLMESCWDEDPNKRPTFSEVKNIVRRLKFGKLVKLSCMLLFHLFFLFLLSVFIYFFICLFVYLFVVFLALLSCSSPYNPLFVLLTIISGQRIFLTTWFTCLKSMLTIWRVLLKKEQLFWSKRKRKLTSCFIKCCPR